jgi:hypothetical protein
MRFLSRPQEARRQLSIAKNAFLAATAFALKCESHLSRESKVKPRKTVSVDGRIKTSLIEMLRWEALGHWRWKSIRTVLRALRFIFD